MSESAFLDGGRELAQLYNKDPLTASLVERIIAAINLTARNSAVAPLGDARPPDPVNAINVKANGEMIHIALQHSAVVNRPIRYFVEADTSPAFPQPHVFDFGASRSGVLSLPTMNDLGAPHSWYFRAYAQYPGSPPSEPAVLGGKNNATAVVLGGTTQMTLLDSSGSGTASPTGQQGAQGMGRFPKSQPRVLRFGKSQASQSGVFPPAASPPIHLLAVILSASSSTSLTQSGTTTAINVGAGVFNVGDFAIEANPGVVDPGAYGKWFVYHDDPSLQGGNVVYQATADVTVLSQGLGRFTDGVITTTSAGGATGGGQTGGGGSCFHPDFLFDVPGGACAAANLRVGDAILGPEGETTVRGKKVLETNAWVRITYRNGVTHLVTRSHFCPLGERTFIRADRWPPGTRVRAISGFTHVAKVEIVELSKPEPCIFVKCEPSGYLWGGGVECHNTLSVKSL